MASLTRAPTLLLLLVLGCSSPTAPDLFGTWGGPDASLVLTRFGGTLSYSCGTGTLDSSWTLREGGEFQGTGQHFFAGGPVPPQGRPPHPARYSGTVQGNAFTLTVTLTDLNLTMGPYVMVRGGPITVQVCV